MHTTASSLVEIGISEAKLTSKSLRKGSTECTKNARPPVEQMTSRMGAIAETGSRNMAVMVEIESSTPTSFDSRNKSVVFVANSSPNTITNVGVCR